MSTSRRGWPSKVAEVFARGEATAFISGNGINKPTGILAYPAGGSVGAGQVQQVNSGNSPRASPTWASSPCRTR